MSNSRRSSVFRELEVYFRGYRIKKQTGKHKDNRESPNTSLCGPAGIWTCHEVLKPCFIEAERLDLNGAA